MIKWEYFFLKLFCTITENALLTVLITEVETDTDFGIEPDVEWPEFGYDERVAKVFFADAQNVEYKRLINIDEQFAYH